MLSKYLNIFQFFFVASGISASFLFDIPDVTHTKPYTVFTYSLLSVGLYGAAVTVDTKELRDNRRIVISAVTIGVLLKTVIIGLILFLVLKNSVAFILGMAVAQIDPLSVASLLQNKISSLSKRAETILAAWSSFDDPMTVILILYITGFVFPSAGGLFSHETLVVGLSFNLLFAAIAYIVFRFFDKVEKMQYILLLICIVFSVYHQLMLGIAIIGLFLRPALNCLSNIVTLSFFLALFLLGVILGHGVSLTTGFIMALAAFIAQVIVAILLTRKLVLRDRVRLALAQQNGITAIILSLLLESSHAGSVAIIAPAIFFINAIYYITNKIADRFLEQKAI